MNEPITPLTTDLSDSSVHQVSHATGVNEPITPLTTDLSDSSDPHL